MFKLTIDEIDSAKAAIDHHGYSTLLPRPPEWADVTTHWLKIKGDIGGLDLDDYTPKRPIIVTVSKKEWGVRHVHLLHPEDLLIYTALTIVIKRDIEAARSPKTKWRSYSYRASSRSDRLYESTKATYPRYIESLERKAAKARTHTVAVTDIADLYASVSHARLRDLFASMARTPRSMRALELLISPLATSFMPRAAHGIPTGPFASRLLAEILLNDIDEFLLDRRVDFVRWVDDLNIFAPSRAAAKDIVLDLSMWLYDNHGLTLQAAKTHFLDVGSYGGVLLQPIDEQLSGNAELLGRLLFGEEYGLDGEDVEKWNDDALAIALLEMLIDAMPQDGGVNYRMVRSAVRRLGRIQLEGLIATEVLEIMVENIDRLTPVIGMVAELVIALLAKTKAPKRIARSLLGSLRRARVNHHAIWILTVLERERRWSFTDELAEVCRAADDDAVRRFAALAIAQAGGRYRLEPREFDEASPLVRLALLRTQTKRERRALRLEGTLERAVG